MNLPPLSSVRGRVLEYLRKHLGKLTGRKVAEVGSRRTQPDAFRDLRQFVDAASYVGFDLQPGPGVDEVLDFDEEEAPEVYHEAFAGVICAEVLEHVKDPAIFLGRVGQLLEVDGLLLVTTLFAFPFHGYPSDYWRFSEIGLRVLLERVGYQVLETANAGKVRFELSDHGEPPLVKTAPIHTFALAARPGPSWL